MKMKRLAKKSDETVSQYLNNLANMKDVCGNPIGILWNNLNLVAYYEEDDDFKYD